MNTAITAPKSSKQLGRQQRRVLERFAQLDGAIGRLSVVELTHSSSSDSQTKRRAQRVSMRRVCRSLVKRGLLREVGTKVSVTGSISGDVGPWRGTRVPKGYERQSLCFELTHLGQRVAATSAQGDEHYVPPTN